MFRLKEIRKKAGITMKQLGEHIGVAESTVSLYESEKREPDNKTLHKLSEFFNVSLDYLLGRDESDIIRMRTEKLQELRQFPIQKIEEALGIEYGTFRTWLSGYTGYFDGEENHKKIAKLYDVSLDYLYGRTNDTSPAPDASLTQKQKEALDMLENLSDENLAKAIDYLELLTNSEK